MQRITGRCALHYGVTLSLFCLYGWQVCPFLESLTLPQLLGPTLVTFAIMFAVRNWLLSRRPLPRNGLDGFGLEVGFYLLGALLLSGYNALAHDFPLESHLKVLLGMTTLGFLVAADLTLERDLASGQSTASRAEPGTEPPAGHAAATQVHPLYPGDPHPAGGVFFLLFNKDLEWLVTVERSLPRVDAQHYILWEIAFVMTVTFCYLALIIHGYGRNLGLSLRQQTRTMARVQCGDFDARVPVTRDDEFGLIAASTNQMIGELKSRSDELNLTRDVAILGLASLAETRDNETGAHIIRTQHYVKALAQYLSRSDWDRYPLDDATIDLLFKSAPLHDVGKVGIPDAILLKPGKLTDEEFAIMKRHPQIGADALASAEAQLGSNSFLRLAREISLTHHEKWDGSGYPAGLAGEDIPLSGRLMAVADVYDALISKRVYKPAFSHEEAKEIIVKGSGSHFDPGIVAAFLACEAQFREIAAQFQDHH